MSALPTALRLADELAAEIERTVKLDMTHHNAAAELRRLHAENEALRADQAECDALRERMADILRRTAVALREALGDPTGKLMQDELVERARNAWADAQRYRWLSAHARSTAEHWGGRWSLVIDGPAPRRHDCADALDEAVDAAMARTRAVSAA